MKMVPKHHVTDTAIGLVKALLDNEDHYRELQDCIGRITRFKASELECRQKADKEMERAREYQRLVQEAKREFIERATTRFEETE